MSCIQEHFSYLYTHLPSNFFSNLPVLHHYSQLHYRYLSPHFTPDSPAAFNISDATPDGPVALPLFALNIANLTSSADVTLLSSDASTLFISKYYPYSNQISHLVTDRNIPSIFALSYFPPLWFSHPPPSHIHSQ